MWLQGFFSNVCSALSLKSVGVLTLTQWKKAYSSIISWIDSILQKFCIQFVFITFSIVIDTSVKSILVVYILMHRLIPEYYEENYGGYYG